MGAMYERLSMEWWWATFARTWAHSSTTLAYQNTLSALRSILVAGLTTRLLYPFFGCLGPRLHIPLEYSSYLIERGQLELAVETIEQGKVLIWSEMFGLRSSTRQLRRANPNLADRLAHFTQALEAINTPISADQGGPDAFSPAFEELQRLLEGRQEVIQKIRALQGFANFMKANTFRTLQFAAAQGPIIIINHCHWRCDVLIVLHDSSPSLIPTNEGLYERANTRNDSGVDSRQYEKELLQELGIPKQSRIWWYPTSVFCSLPLHAMGPRYFSDIYSRASPKPDPQLSLLLVAQPDRSTPGVWGEMQAIQSIRIPVTVLAVVENLPNHTLAHFACHGSLGAEVPLDAAIRLYGDDRLTLRDIANLRLPPAELAFLSACHTAEPTDGDDPTEGLNIAAAMQYHGFRSMADADGRDISEPFYEHLLARGSESHDVPLGERSARALRDAVRRLRKRKDITVGRWANWVH
ncbi:hypothetical protein EDB92DRAFT_1936994 [Lactarius akahatsu]|uniref:CHAT domain-containing protein n=1 Tax=Lactarius akahatsu TaxID=416441 RepID=A0AAD4L9X8_9AGAM|nr:hypothetical protein EDB92DRAFT_1936994 [Lactarius akahatsu]